MYIHLKECPLRDTIPLTSQEDIREESEGTEDEEISRPAEGTSTKKNLVVSSFSRSLFHPFMKEFLEQPHRKKSFFVFQSQAGLSLTKLSLGRNNFYVTDGNIMYLTDASRSLISCVIQHYAPVMGWEGGGTDA